MVVIPLLQLAGNQYLFLVEVIPYFNQQATSSVAPQLSHQSHDPNLVYV